MDEIKAVAQLDAFSELLSQRLHFKARKQVLP